MKPWHWIIVALGALALFRALPPYQFVQGPQGLVWRCNRVTGSAAWSAPGNDSWHYTRTFSPPGPHDVEKFPKSFIPEP